MQYTISISIFLKKYYNFRLACGIIARSAGILQNYKKICACDGVTIWDERDKPLAGGNRSVKTPSNQNGKL